MLLTSIIPNDANGVQFLRIIGAQQLGTSTVSSILPNIASLRALDSSTWIAVGPIFIVGYYTPTIDGTPDGGGGLFNYDSTDYATFSGSITGTTLTATGITGSIKAGQTLYGGTVSAGTIIAEGTGPWVVNNSQTATCTSSHSADNNGTIIVDSSTVPRVWKRIFEGGRHNVKWFGAYGDFGNHDDYPPFVDCLKAILQYSQSYPTSYPTTHYQASTGSMYMPGPAIYELGTGLDLSAYAPGSLTIQGDGGMNAAVAVTGVRLKSGVSGNTMTADTFGSITMRDFNIDGGDQSGNAALYFHAGNTLSIDNVGITPGRVNGWGIRITGAGNENPVFQTMVTNCNVTGDSVHPTSVGIYSRAHSRFINVDTIGCGEGYRCCGPSTEIMGCRIEVNNIGVRLGYKDDQPAGSTTIPTVFELTSCRVGEVSFESNGTAIIIGAVAATNIDNVLVTGFQTAAHYPPAAGATPVNPIGSTNLGAGYNPQYGIVTIGATNVSISNTLIQLYADKTAYYAYNDQDVVFNNVNLINTNSAKPINTIPPSVNNNVTRSSNCYLRYNDTWTSADLIKQINLRTLAADDYLNPTKQGANLRAKNVALGNGVSSIAIAFAPALGAFLSNSTTATAGAGLANGTYYYWGTVITQNGETIYFGTPNAATCGGGNNRITITWVAVGSVQYGYRRRVYRTTSSTDAAVGIFDGFFETGLNTDANFVDSGQPFSGFGYPPFNGCVDTTSCLEPDGNYGVLVTPSWLTTVKVTSKATTGFTVTFGTATPDANQTIDWFLVR